MWASSLESLPDYRPSHPCSGLGCFAASSGSITTGPFLVTSLKPIFFFFFANKEVHRRRRRLIALIGGVFVLQAFMIVDVNAREAEGEAGRSGGRGLRQKHVSQSFLSVGGNKHV